MSPSTRTMLAADCHDSAMAESRFSSMRRKLAHHETFGDRALAWAGVLQRITMYYQRTHLHSALGYFSTALFQEMPRRVG